MPKENLKNLIRKEVERVDKTGTTKRKELVIEGFKKSNSAPKAIIKGKAYSIFNSNDYLGLRFDERLRKAEELASKKYGTGPGAVRFISGTIKLHKELEAELAKFHNKEDAMLFSSAFAANLAVIHCFIKGQSKDSLISADTLVITDELNHRSIIDGIRVAGLNINNKAIFKHLDLEDLRKVLYDNTNSFKRVVLVTDGIFSMLGDYQNLAKMNQIVKEFDSSYEEGIITIVDDSHGVASFGESGRGCEEFCNAKVDLLVATMGKGFGADGGYAVGDKDLINYLKESAATYIYSNSISPGTTGAALESVKLLISNEGKKLIEKLNDNILYFKERMKEAGFKFAADSKHAIQPVLIGDPISTRELVDELFKRKILVTNISYPIVPKGRDEIRIQLSAVHTKHDLDYLIKEIEEAAKILEII